MKYYIIVFKNTLDAMSGEKAVKEMGLSFRMMPTPTSITQSCGLCVRLDDEESVNKVINEGNMSYNNIYKWDIYEYSLVREVLKRRARKW